MSERMTVVITGQDAGASATAQKVAQSFRGVGTEAERMNRALDAIERNTAETARALDAMSREALEADRALAKAESTGQKFSRTGAALGATVSAVTGILSEAARAAAEEEAIFARLETAVDATGASFDDYAVSIEGAIEGAQELSFADDEAAEALTRLTTITGDAGEALDLLGLSMDVARGRGISLAEASTLVGKAAEGQTAALSRMGIVLQEGASAQEALAALQQRYAGQAEAYAETTQGAIDRLTNTFDDWIESIGASTGELQAFITLLPGISAGVSGAAAVVGGLSGNIGRLTFLLNPLSLALGGVALATAGVIKAWTEWGDLEDSVVLTTDEVVESTEDLVGQLARLKQQGVDDATIFNLQKYTETIFDIGRASNAISASDLAMAQDIIRGTGDAATDAAIPLDEYGNALVGLAGDSREWAEAIINAHITDEQYRQGLEDTNAILSDSSRINYPLLVAEVDRLTDAWLAGDITAEEYLARLHALAEGADSFGLSLSDLNPIIDSSTQLLEDYAAGLSLAQIEAAEFARSQEEAAEASQRAAVLFGDGVGVLHETLPGAADDLLNFTDALALANQAAEQGARGPFQLLGEIVQAIDDELVTEAESWTGLGGAIAYANSEAAQATATHDFLLGAIGESAGAVYAAADAVDWYGSRLDALSGIESEAAGTVNDLQQAYDILTARIEAGEPLTQAQLDFYNEAPGLIAEYTRESEDAAVAQGILIANHEDARSVGEQLNDTMAGLTDVLEELVRALGGDVPAAAGRAKDALADLLNLGGGGSPLSGLAGSIAAALGTPAAVPAIPSQPGDLSGGPAPTAPLAPPIGVLPVQAAPLVVEFEADYSSVVEAAAAVEGLLEEATGEPYTVELVGDGEDASAVIRDVEGEVVAVVDEDYVIYLTGDSGQAVSAIDAAMRELAAADGSAATVTVYANTSPAANAIAAQLGYQGDAWINVYANPIGGGFTNPNVAYASGGVVEAAMGRVVRAGEIGPELVYPPGGAPYLAARDGLYVMSPGTFVSNAAATSASGGGRAGLTVVFNNYGTVGVDDLLEKIVDALDQSLAMSFENRYREIGWPYGT